MDRVPARFVYVGYGVINIYHGPDENFIAEIRVTTLLKWFRAGDVQDDYATCRLGVHIDAAREIIKEIMFGSCTCAAALAIRTLSDDDVALITRMGGHIDDHTNWLDCIALRILLDQRKNIKTCKTLKYNGDIVGSAILLAALGYRNLIDHVIYSSTTLEDLYEHYMLTAHNDVDKANALSIARDILSRGSQTKAAQRESP